MARFANLWPKSSVTLALNQNMKNNLKNQTKPIALAISAVAMCACVAVQAQTVIDPLNGSISPYTYYLVNDSGHGNGDGISYSESTGALVATGAGPTSAAEQALYLAPATSFSTTFAVGDTLEVSTTVPAGSTAEDIGLAISGSNPVAGTPAGDASGVYSSRDSFDWASISVRPSQTSIRQNTDVNGGAVTTGSFVVAGVNPTTVTGLYITWVTPLSFNLGYLTASGAVSDDTVTFEAGSSIGSEIGFYDDVRTTGANIGSLSNLAIVPEPSTLSLCGVGLVGLIARARKWRK
jgi:hypothetical protein